jgi:hypothetical protein
MARLGGRCGSGRRPPHGVIASKVVPPPPCERGLSIDGFRDGLWRMAVTAHERRGHHAVAERVRQSYEQVLRDLGVSTTG